MPDFWRRSASAKDLAVLAGRIDQLERQLTDATNKMVEQSHVTNAIRNEGVAALAALRKSLKASSFRARPKPKPKPKPKKKKKKAKKKAARRRGK